MTTRPDILERIKRTDELLTNPTAVISTTNNALRNNISAIACFYSLFAKPEYTYKEIGAGKHKWQPRYDPNFVRFLPGMNPDRLSTDTGAYSPFSQEGPPANVLGILLAKYGGIMYVRYDVMPEGSDLVVSVMYDRDSVVQAGNSPLELTAR